MINWLRTLNSASIEYVERGPNVKRGEVNIRCPFCGNADPSHHLGLNLTTGWWACWRNKAHRGKSPLRLLVRLLGCSYARACEIAGIGADYIDPEGFDALAARLLHGTGMIRTEEVRREFISFPERSSMLVPKGRTRRHWEYLVRTRGFAESDLDRLISQYSLMAGVGGEVHDRVVIPYVMHGKMVAWTARAITPTATLRYRDIRLDDALVPPKHTLYNHDASLVGGRVLLVVEGPIDSLKLDYYGMDWGVRAVAASTNSLTDQQIFLLEEAAPRFTRVLMMMDNASSLGVVDSYRIKEQLSQIPNLGMTPVPFGAKDGGDLTPRQVVEFSRRIINE